MIQIDGIRVDDDDDIVQWGVNDYYNIRVHIGSLAIIFGLSKSNRCNHLEHPDYNEIHLDNPDWWDKAQMMITNKIHLNNLD